MFAYRFALAGNARDRKTMRLGIVINITLNNIHVCVMSKTHAFPTRISSITPGEKNPMMST